MNLGSWLAAFKTAVAARSDITTAGVEVVIVPAPDKSVENVLILLAGDTESNVEWEAIGNKRHDDDLTIPGKFVAVERTGERDVAIAAALDRAHTVILAVLDQLRTTPPTLGAQTFRTSLTDVRFAPGPSDKGGWGVDTTFNLRINARFN